MSDARELAASFDPERLPPEFFENPYPTYAALRELDPAHRCPDGSIFLTRHADLSAVYRDRMHFSSDKQTVFAPKFGTGTPLYEHHTSSLVFNDPPYHTRVRRQIVGALTPAAIRGMVPGLEALVDDLCDEMEARRDADLIEHFAAAIPVEVIGNLLGVPRGERGPLRAWSLAILGALDPGLSPEQLALGQRSVSEFLEFSRELVSDRRRHQIGIGDRGETDEGHAIRDVLGKSRGNGQGEPGLAHATRSGQGQQPDVGLAQEVSQRGSLVLPAEEWCLRKGERRCVGDR